MATKTDRLPGTEKHFKTFPELDEAALDFESKRDAWQRMGEEMNQANDLVVEKMRQYKLSSYKNEEYSPPLVVELKAKDPTVRAKVSRDKEKPAE